MKNNTGDICTRHAKERLAKWQVENKNTSIKEGDSVKIEFTQKGKKPEWMWVTVQSQVSETEFTGYLDNDPDTLTNVKYKDNISFDFSEIADLIPKR